MAPMNSHSERAGAILWACIIVTAGMSAFAVTQVLRSDAPPEDGFLPSFSSMDDLMSYLESTRPSDLAQAWLPIGVRDGASEGYDGGAPTYSETNVQVEGVDEHDIVKTNGDLLFVASHYSVSILKASPPEDMSVLSTIESGALAAQLPEGVYCYVVGMYIHGDRLVVLTSFYGYAVGQSAMVMLFDVGLPSEPRLVSSHGVSGSLIDSRLAGGTLYILTNLWVWPGSGDDQLRPSTWEDGRMADMDLGAIRYDPDAESVDSYLVVMALDLDTLDREDMAILSATGSGVYMSLDSLYVTSTRWPTDLVFIDDPVAPDRTIVDLSSMVCTTTIFRIAMDGLDMEVVARGEVDGWPLNQFSMDEHKGYLRVATTTSWAAPENAVYVLRDDLSVVGQLEGLAPSERIFSARFMGDTLYLVTFEQIDPLFVIDLTDPGHPRVLGELKVPGFSNYLHPLGDGLLLGIGQENSSVKISVFDVSVPTTPTEVDTFVIGSGTDDWSYSYTEASWDHHAVTYDPERRMLVIPVHLSVWTQTDYIYETNYFRWDGFYVFEILASGEIALTGEVDHSDYCKRSVYIGDCLYTVSSSDVVASSLPDLSHIVSVAYATTDWNYTEQRG